jgi:hypothetical protein
MLPLDKLSSPIRVEMYTSANDDAIYYGSAGAGAIWQLVNVELELCYVEIDEDGFDDTHDIDYISTQSYRQTSATLPGSYSGEFTTLLHFRFASMTALYCRFRNQSSAVQGANATAAYRKSSSINPNFGSYYARVGAAIYPNKPVYLINGYLSGSGSEAYAELLKSFHSLASITGDPAIRAQEYNVSSSSYANGLWNSANIPCSKRLGNIDTFANAFAIGMEFQTFSNRNDTICSGINTQNTQMFFTGTIYTGLQAGGAIPPAAPSYATVTCDFFAQYDMMLVIQDGIMRAQF